MQRNAFDVPNVDVLAMLGIALLLAWARLRGISVRDLCAQAALSVAGHLRSRPDPAIEGALRTAFVSLDEELAAVLGDRAPRQMASPPTGPRTLAGPRMPVTRYAIAPLKSAESIPHQTR